MWDYARKKDTGSSDAVQPPAVKTPAGQAAVQEKGDKPLRERHCEREDPPRRRGAPLGRKSAIAAAL